MTAYLLIRDLRLQDNTNMPLGAYLTVIVPNSLSKRESYLMARIAELYRECNGRLSVFADKAAFIRATKHLQVTRNQVVQNTLYGQYLAKSDGSPYKVFGPFADHCRTIKPDKPVKFHGDIAARLPGSLTLAEINRYEQDQRGTRRYALKQLKSAKCWLRSYESRRNNPMLGNTGLSYALAYGILSPREVFYALPVASFRTQLYWRDFYKCIFGLKAPLANYSVRWRTAGYKAWCKGRTGVAIVDAGMTELNTTGFMHNRLRMIVATFLIFNLSIDWRLGEKYFKSRLIDYDPEQNMGNWRWVAAMDTFSNDLYKTMSVDRQAERFDPDGAYRDKWLGKNWKESDFDVAGTRARGIKLLAK